MPTSLRNVWSLDVGPVGVIRNHARIFHSFRVFMVDAFGKRYRLASDLGSLEIRCSFSTSTFLFVWDMWRKRIFARFLVPLDGGDVCRL